MIRKNLYRTSIRTRAFFTGWKIWNELLESKGIANYKLLPSNEQMTIGNDMFKSFFSDTVKNEKIVLKNISKTYDNGFKAVDNFTLEIQPNDFVCLLGPSGCGKTTALRMMAGLDTITSGHYYIGNKEMNSTHPSERKTAMVFQNYALYPFMSVYNNVAFGLKLKTYKNTKIDQKLTDLILIKNPEYFNIKNLKHLNKELRNPFSRDIQQLQVKLKQAQILQDESSITEIQPQFTSIENKREEILASNKSLIENNLAQIQKLEKQNQEIKDQKKTEWNLKRDKLTEEIATLKNEERVYFEEKKNVLNSHFAELERLKLEIKRLEKERNEILKSSYANFKLLKKQNASDAQITQEKKSMEMKIVEIESSIATLSKQYSNEKQSTLIIKQKHYFAIKELKLKLKSEFKIEMKKAVELAVVWKKSIPGRVFKISEIVGISNYLNRKPAALSGGQRQRVALIRAISKDAQLFLFDEPLSNLDAKLRGTMRTVIKIIHNFIGATSLYVTHDQIEAMTMANKVVVMNVGYIQQVDTPKNLYDNPANAFVAKFIGVPSINMIEGTIKGKEFSFSQGEQLTLCIPKAKEEMLLSANKTGPALLGVRPQDITFVDKETKSSIKGTIKILELIGSEYLAIVETSIAKNLRVIVPADANVQLHDIVNIEFNHSNLHAFDAETGFAYTSIINDETKAAQKVWHKGVQERIKNKILLAKETNLKVSLPKKAVDGVNYLFNKEEQNRALVDKINKTSVIYEDYKLVEKEDAINS